MHADFDFTRDDAPSFFREIRTNARLITVRIFSRISAVSFTRESASASSPSFRAHKEREKNFSLDRKSRSRESAISRAGGGGGGGGGVNQDGK